MALTSKCKAGAGLVENCDAPICNAPPWVFRFHTRMWMRGGCRWVAPLALTLALLAGPVGAQEVDMADESLLPRSDEVLLPEDEQTPSPEGIIPELAPEPPSVRILPFNQPVPVPSRGGPLFRLRSADRAVEMARSNAAQTAGLQPDQVAVLSVQPTEFSDLSLGCGSRGRFFAQVVVPGFIVVVDVAGTQITYHSDGALRAIECEANTPLSPAE
jgi:hypothetical protein